MHKISNKVILWDFDGVILDSMPVRSNGFAEVLKDYPADKVQLLLKYHQLNGGLSRYVKFRYFFENILNQTITEAIVNELAEAFSIIMLKLLANPKLLIEDSLYYIQNNFDKHRMHIVSGSDQTELRTLCQQLQLSPYFISIHGSPKPKKELVANLLKKFKYPKEDVILIGDSINDKDAAETNGIDFIAYNNIDLLALVKEEKYIRQFRTL